MKKISYKKEGIDDPFINLTPLIDVVFVILVAFIMVAPLLEVDKVDLAGSGKNTEKESLVKSPVAIYVRSDNSIYCNKRLVEPSELLFFLKEKRKLYPQTNIQLYHDKKACFGTYQMVKNCVEEAGFASMDVVLKPDGS